MSEEAASAVAIVGSRDYPRLDLVRRFVASLPRGTTVVSGGARGVDKTAEDAWRSLGGQVRSIEAEWELIGNTAGIERNGMIVLESQRLYAFFDGQSAGTANTICRAANAGTLRWIAGPDGRRDTARLLLAAWAIEEPKKRLTRKWNEALYAGELTFPPASATEHLPQGESDHIVDIASSHGGEGIQYAALQSGVRM